MTNCEIRFNKIGQYRSGVGMYFADGPAVTMTDCVFAENRRYSTSWEISGGGFAINGGSVTASNCNFYDNNIVVSRDFVAEGCGGAVMLENGAVGTFTDCVFSNNVIQPNATSPGHGGAIAVGRHGASTACQATLRNCTVVSNSIGAGSTTTEGGAFFVDGGSTLTLVNTLVAGNSVGGGNGGALYLQWGSVYATNCTIADSSALLDGGGIHVLNGAVQLKNCILSGNAAGDEGDEIYITGAGSSVTSRYSSFAGTNSTYVHVNAGTVSWGPGIITGDPLFASSSDWHLQSSGGRYDPAFGWVYDSEVSPCIDAGEPTDDVGDETVPNGGTINLGAYGGTVEASRSAISGMMIILR